MRSKIDVFVFDINGTLYLNHALFLSIFSIMLKNFRFMSVCTGVRIIFWNMSIEKERKLFGDFFQLQANPLPKKLCFAASFVQADFQKTVYEGLRNYFEKNQKGADIFFSDYRQFLNKMLQSKLKNVNNFLAKKWGD